MISESFLSLLNYFSWCKILFLEPISLLSALPNLGLEPISLLSAQINLFTKSANSPLSGTGGRWFFRRWVANLQNYALGVSPRWRGRIVEECFSYMTYYL